MIGKQQAPKEEEMKSSEPLQPLTKAEKIKAALSVEKSLSKEYGGVILQKMNDRVGERLPSFSTELISLDEELFGCGGCPKGRIIEIFGPEASGKTTISLQIIAAVQAAGGMAALIDAEHSLNPNHAADIGVDLNELLISQPDNGEQALEIVAALVRARAVDVIVVDSVAALVPKAELEGDMGDSHMGLQARLMSQALRILTGLCNTNGVTIIFINQIREKLGVQFGDPETTTGGRALKFYSSVRIKIRQLSRTDGGIIEEDGVRVGQRSRLVAVKNKCGTPYSETDLTLTYGKGWDKKSDVIDYAVKLGVLESGAWYTLKETGERFRRKDLTDEHIFSILNLAVKKEIEDRRVKRNEEAKKQSQSTCT
jgi:recombination protein RecA